MTTVIYGLRCPLTGAIRYIGKTIDPQRRLKAHLGCRTKRHPRDCWIASLKSSGLEPEMVILRELADGDDWAAAEQEEIARGFAAGLRLFNRTIGGEGAPLTAEERAAKTVRMRDPATRAKMSASAKARWADPEKRAAGAAANASPEKRARLAEAARKRSTPEYRAAMSERSAKAWADAEKRARIVAGITPEVRSKVSAAAREMWKTDPERAARMRPASPDLGELWKQAEYRAAQQRTRAMPEFKERASRSQKAAWERRRQKG